MSGMVMTTFLRWINRQLLRTMIWCARTLFTYVRLEADKDKDGTIAKLVLTMSRYPIKDNN